MANQNESAQDYLDVRVTEASRLFKFYLNQEKNTRHGFGNLYIFFGSWLAMPFG
jgi:hypothetical protein